MIAIKNNRKRQAHRQPQKLYHCSDCQNSYDWRSEALDGHLILCRCKHYTEGRWCKFLSDYQCAHFIKRDERKADGKTQ